MSFAPDQLFCLRWNNHQANIVEVFDKLLENETFTDVTLAVDNGVFVKCHKMVLAACSTYFQGLFTELPCTHPIVVLKDIKYAEIKEILEYMYTGEVKVAQEHLAQFVRIANILQVKGLMSDSTSLTISKLITHNDEVISTSTLNNPDQILESNGGAAAGQSSPPHSTSSPYYGYGKSPTRRNQRPNVPLPMWPLHQGQSSAVDLAALQSSLSMRHSLFASQYDNTIEATTTHSRKNKSNGNNSNNGNNASTSRNHDTPILRNVLGQGHVDSSHSNTDGHEYRTHSNGSANNDNEPRRGSVDAANCPPSHSPYANDTSMLDDDDKKISPPSYADDAKAGLASYAPAQKPEWKRYKQYTRDDISNAIEAVRRGMSALQAARKFGVPSRTLYDKVKKLGITTSRPFRRSSNSSGACFPYGVGGNVNGSIYGPISESENDNSNVLMDNPAALLETAFTESHGDDSRDRESMMDVARPDDTPSPQPLPPYAHHRPISSADDPPHQDTTEDMEDQVEDLSINRRTDVRVIMSPNVTVKEEN